jgi:hypothetical protein
MEKRQPVLPSHIHSRPCVKIFAIEGQIDRPNHRMFVMRKKEGRKERKKWEFDGAESCVSRQAVKISSA